MASPLAVHKLNALGRIALGVVLILVGLRLHAGLRFVLVLLGTFQCARGASRFIRIWAHEQRLLSEMRGTTQAFRRAGLPRQIYWLLLAVAEADGGAGEEERALVRRFVLERFTGPVTIDDLRTWDHQRPPPEQAGVLAVELGRLLSPAECETVFYWSCLVAFVDRRFRPDEHAVLQDVARGLGLAGHHARIIFHHAKARFLGEQGGFRAGGSRAGTASASPRRRALAVLGLEGDASRDEIRRRHRELVKRYHPDAHAHLGPVAAEEAARRFREIQEAYEMLSNGA